MWHGEAVAGCLQRTTTVTATCWGQELSTCFWTQPQFLRPKGICNNMNSEPRQDIVGYKRPYERDVMQELRQFCLIYRNPNRGKQCLYHRAGDFKRGENYRRIYKETCTGWAMQHLERKGMGSKNPKISRRETWLVTWKAPDKWGQVRLRTH